MGYELQNHYDQRTRLCFYDMCLFKEELSKVKVPAVVDSLFYIMF